MEILHFKTFTPTHQGHKNRVGTSRVTPSKNQSCTTGNGAKYHTEPSAERLLEPTGVENAGIDYKFNGAPQDNSTKHYAQNLYLNLNGNANMTPETEVATPTPNSTKELIVSKESSQYPVDCVGRRRQPIGEKCFALLLVILITGLVLVAFGTSCIIPVQSRSKLEYCAVIGGFITGLTILCGGACLLLLGTISCILINECSGRELHGGRCHINCHIFEDLVE